MVRAIQIGVHQIIHVILQQDFIQQSQFVIVALVLEPHREISVGIIRAHPVNLDTRLMPKTIKPWLFPFGDTTRDTTRSVAITCDGVHGRVAATTSGTVCPSSPPPPPASTYTLTVNSTGASGVAITGNPATYGGSTNYTKSNIPQNTSITLTAPATVSGANFTSWTGCASTNAVARTCTVTMDMNRTVEVSIPPTTYHYSPSQFEQNV